MLPPLVPMHVHVQGAVFETAEGVPAEQRFDAGAVEKKAPFDAPQLPFTAVGIAATTAFVAVMGTSHDRKYGTLASALVLAP